MADKKISELQALTTLDTADIMVAVDISANETKKITGPNLATYINNQFPAETIRDTIGAMLTGNTETDITVTHDDANDKINFVVSVSASNLPSSIDAAKIGDGSVSNTEFERLDGVTSNIQTQIDTKLNKAGGTMTGVLAMGSNAITTSSTVDGRDVSTDGTKLDGIENAATADQTNSEIRTAIEAATDSNVFTDADHTKLNSIEANATADQTNAEIRTAVEAASDSNVFTDADHTKLNAIEASADVTDTANVTSAGALMDSELANLAAVKGINQTLATTSSPTFAGITGPLTGNASTATTLATARTINLGGEVTGSASFNGGSDITITGTIAANSIGINELALNDGSNGQFIQTDGSGTITFASAIGSSVINNSAANRITTVNANASDFDAESNLTFDGSTLALTGNMTASGTIDGVDISARDSVLTSTTTTANAALPKAGGAMTGAITSASDLTLDVAGDIILDADGADVSFRDDGTGHLSISNSSNDAVITSLQSDKDMIFKGVDGGSLITALTLDMSNSGRAVFNAGGTFNDHVYFGDNDKAVFGGSNDLEIYHNGTDNYIYSNNKALRVQGNGSPIKISPVNAEMSAEFKANDAVDLYFDNSKKFETYASGAKITGNLWLTDDNGKGLFGANTDLQIFHDSTDNIINNHSADLHIKHGSEFQAKFIQDGAVELYHNNSKKIETTSAGITVTGTATVVDDVSVSGATPSITLTDTDDNSDCMVYQAAGNLYLEADKNSEASGSFLRMAVDDLDMVHIYNGQTVFNESSRDQNFRVESNANANMIFVDAGNDHVNIGTASDLGGMLNVDGNIAVSGTVDGIDIATRDGVLTSTTTTAGNALPKAGGTMTGDLKFNDSIQAKFGNSEDFKIYHNGSQTILDDSGTGSVELRSNTFGIATSGGSASMASFVEGGAVNLYNNGTLRANTTGSGFAVTGDMTASGNITAYSDERLKSDIKTIHNALDKVSQMRGVTFTKDDKLSSGVIAQEMEKIAPELVIDGEYKSVAYGNTVGYLIEAIKELKAEIEILKKDK